MDGSFDPDATNTSFFFLTKVAHQTPNGTEMWGPAYNKTFLAEVFKLQNIITQEVRFQVYFEGFENVSVIDSGVNEV